MADTATLEGLTQHPDEAVRTLAREVLKLKPKAEKAPGQKKTPKA